MKDKQILLGLHQAMEHGCDVSHLNPARRRAGLSGESLLKILIGEKQQTPLTFRRLRGEEGSRKKDGHRQPFLDLAFIESLLLKQ